jgi:hypothetical protein
MSQKKDFPARDPQLFYELARDRLSTQLSLIDALDSKVISLLGFASALLGILAAVFALRASRATESTGVLGVLLLAAASVTYGVVAWHGIRAYRSRSINLGPDLREVWDATWSDGDDALVKWQVANACWSHYEENRVVQETKSNALPPMLVAVVIQSVLVVLALVWVAVVA